MTTSIEKLRLMMDVGDYTEFNVPLVYVKKKTILTLNSSNRMQFHQRMSIKNKYKAIIEPIINRLSRFDGGHIHMIMQIHFSDRRSRDMDNQIFTLKWVQDCIVECGKLDDDKNVSFTFLPAINDPSLDEHYCQVTAIDLFKNNYFKRLRDNEN